VIGELTRPSLQSFVVIVFYSVVVAFFDCLQRNQGGYCGIRLDSDMRDALHANEFYIFPGVPCIRGWFLIACVAMLPFVLFGMLGIRNTSGL
jgi:hypothetical protein